MTFTASGLPGSHAAVARPLGGPAAPVRRGLRLAAAVLRALPPWLAGLATVLNGMLASLLLVTVAHHIVARREQAAIEIGWKDARRQAGLVGLQWSEVLQKIDDLQRTALAETPALARGEAAAADRLAAAIRPALSLESFRGVSDVAVIAPDGTLLWSATRDLTLATRLADRSEVAAMATRGEQRSVGRPLRGRQSGEWVIPFLRGARAADGSVAGIVVVGYQGAAVAGLAQRLQQNALETAGVWRQDGSPLALGPGSAPSGPQSLFGGLCPTTPGPPTVLTYRGRGLTDDTRRLIAAECLPGTGTFVTVSIAEASVLQPSWDTVAGLWRGSLFGCGLLAAGTALLTMVFEQRRSMWASRQREARLLADQALFRDLLDNVGDTLVKGTRRAGVQYVSAGIRNLLKHDPAQVLGHPVLDLVHPDDRPLAIEYWQAVNQGPPRNRHEIRLLRSDGGVVWVDVKTVRVAVRGEADPVFFAALRNVTEKHHYLASLEAAKAELETLLTLGPGVHVRVRIRADGTRQPTFVAPQGGRETGFSAAELADPARCRCRIDGDLDALRDRAFDASPTPGRATFEFRMRRDDGGWRYVRSFARREALPGGEQDEVSQYIDVTAEHEAEAARQLAESRLADLIENSPGVLFQWELDEDGAGRPLYISPNAAPMLGYDDTTRPAQWESIADPLTFAAWPQVWRRAMQTGEGQWEYRIRHADGEWRWARSSFRARRQPDGAWLQTGFITDVTRQRAIEAELQRSQADFQAIIETGPGTVFRCTQDAAGAWREIWRSENYEAITGYSQAEAAAPAFWRRTMRVDPGEQRAAALRASATPGLATWDYDFLHQDGRWLRVAENLRIVAGSNGAAELIVYTYDITLPFQAARDMQAAKERLDTLLAAAPGALFQIDMRPDAGEGWTYMSEGVAHLAGYAAADFLRVGLTGLYDEVSHQRHRAAVAAAATRGAASYEARLRRADGAWIWARVHLRSLRQDRLHVITGFISDTTQQRATLQDLIRTRRELQEAVEAGPGALLRLRVGERSPPHLLFASGAVQRLTGYTPREALANGWPWTAVDPDCEDAMRRCYAAVLAMAPGSVELRLQTKQGAWRWVQMTVRPQERVEEGAVLVVAYLLDITQQKEQQARLMQAAKLATLGEMTTSLAHELNQPLAIMSIAAENARDDLRHPGGVAAALRRLDRIHNQARRASSLIDHLRVFGRNQQSGTAPVSLQDVMAGVTLLASARTGQSGVRVIDHVPDDLPLVNGNQVLLEQVLLNLIANACDAYEIATPHPPVGQRLVTITAHGAADRVTLTVADRAGGIPPALLDRVFEPFFTTKVASKGTGVGLSFCYGVVTDMNGTMKVSNSDGGAVFEMTLPVAADTRPGA